MKLDLSKAFIQAYYCRNCDSIKAAYFVKTRRAREFVEVAVICDCCLVENEEGLAEIAGYYAHAMLVPDWNALIENGDDYFGYF